MTGKRHRIDVTAVAKRLEQRGAECPGNINKPIAIFELAGKESNHSVGRPDLDLVWQELIGLFFIF